MPVNIFKIVVLCSCALNNTGKKEELQTTNALKLAFTFTDEITFTVVLSSADSSHCLLFFHLA